ARVGGLATGPNGDVFFSDHSGIHKIEHAAGTVGVFKAEGGAAALAFGPDGRLCASQPTRKRIVAYSPNGSTSKVADGIEANALFVDARGEVWFTDGSGRRIGHVDARRRKRVVQEGLGAP